MRVDKPQRVSHSYVQLLDGSADQVFPLYCPVREADWIDGWDPVAVYSESGVAEDGCVFVTRDDDGDAAWIITRFEPSTLVEMIKHKPGWTMCRLTITLEPVTTATCKAHVTYSHTSLGAEGDRFLAGFTREFYESFMQRWQDDMNHYLRTGEKCPAEHE